MYCKTEDDIISITNMKAGNTSLVLTTFNEDQSIGKLIESVVSQSVLPGELIIVDGQSRDNTVKVINKLQSVYRKKLPIKFFIKKGNRSVGRNEGVSKSQGGIILFTDAGCILDKNWVKNIIQPFKHKNTDLVAGYYKGLANSVFQKCLIPYVLVMKDRIKKEFLPATRSMAIRRSSWEKINGFDENLFHNEDYAFANRAKEKRMRMVFAKDAVVNWIPRSNLRSSFIMFFRFALGDAQAKIFRSKVMLIFARYLLVAYLLLLSFIMHSIILIGVLVFLFFLYIFWSIWKNYKYVRNYQAFFYLPLLQFLSDFAVIIGTKIGLLQGINVKNIFKLIKENRSVSLLIIAYVIVLLILLPLGIPNNSHPFAYFMDEWHQSQAVRTVFKYGTPNIAGSANGSMFQFLLSGIYLIPFYFLGLVNPFAISSSVANLSTQNNLFLILRLNTLLFGVASIVLFAHIAKRFHKLNSGIATFIFVVNPLWLTLSNYFKYDIALIFWILAFFLFCLKYSKSGKMSDYLAAGFFAGLAFATKISAVPLLPIYIMVYPFAKINLKKNLRFILFGLSTFVFTFILFGIPDIILGKGNLYEYLHSNLVSSPELAVNAYNLGMDYINYLFQRMYPVTFGHAYFYVFLISLAVFTLLLIKDWISLGRFKFFETEKKYLLIILFFFWLAASLYPLKIEAKANRVLVLLPFMSLIMTDVFYRAKTFIKMPVLKNVFLFLILGAAVIQVFETYSWLPIRFNKEPRTVSSYWIFDNIPTGTILGVENIPVYQFLPDLIVSDFYNKQYNIKYQSRYNYEVVSSKTKYLPKIVVVTNDDLGLKYFNNSDKKNLTERLIRENYKVIAKFQPDFKNFKLINNEFDFFMSGLVFSPNTISIYKKN
ncbi:glycosyltransferase [Patescibacteria group bacterium]|nr:glycosyltransferase [Patescibacteria group bacterium]